MTNTTTTTAPSHTNANAAIAIILPSLFAIVLIVVIAIALLLPRLNPTNLPESKEERGKRRMARLDKALKAQHFVEWASKQQAAHPETPIARNPLCVICLEEIEDAAQIRGLGCLHVFHQQCLDDWFARWNEYCPLCHRPIIQGGETRGRVELLEGREGDERAVTVAEMV